MNRGFIRGLGDQGQKYTPLIASVGAGATTQPLCDKGTWGRYNIVPVEQGASICVGYANFQWGGAGSAGTGSLYAFSLPVPVMPGSDSASTDYFIGGGMIGRILGSHDMPASLYTLGGNVGTNDQYIPNYTPFGLNAMGWAQLVIGHYFQGGSGAFVASTSKVQAHGLGVAPDYVQVTSTAQASTGRISVNSVDATNITLEAQLSSSGGYYYTVFRNSAFAGPTSPWAWGTSDDHIEIFFMYTVA